MNESIQLPEESQITLDELRKKHPQLTEKAIVDYVNGLEVLDDNLRIRNEICNSLTVRILDDIIGITAERQRIFDLNVADSLRTISVWLQNIEFSQAESDIAITHIANKLVETRAVLMRLQEKHQELEDAVQEISQDVENFQTKIYQRFAEVESLIQQVDARTLANAHLEQVFNKWEAGRLDNYPLLARLYFTIDELYWGDFGKYCRNNLEIKKVEDLIEQLHNKIISQVKQDLQGNFSQLTLSEEWLSPIKNLPLELREALGYLSDWGNPQTTPIIWTMSNIALTQSSSLTLGKYFPCVFSGERVIHYLMYEHKKRKQINYDY